MQDPRSLVGAAAWNLDAVRTLGPVQPVPLLFPQTSLFPHSRSAFSVLAHHCALHATLQRSASLLGAVLASRVCSRVSDPGAKASGETRLQFWGLQEVLGEGAVAGAGMSTQLQCQGGASAPGSCPSLAVAGGSCGMSPLSTQPLVCDLSSL